VNQATKQGRYLFSRQQRGREREKKKKEEASDSKRPRNNQETRQQLRPGKRQEQPEGHPPQAIQASKQKKAKERPSAPLL
jgi:hypothetical protein